MPRTCKIDKGQVGKMHSEGLSAKEIAAQLKCSKQSVWDILAGRKVYTHKNGKLCARCGQNSVAQGNRMLCYHCYTSSTSDCDEYMIGQSGGLTEGCRRTTRAGGV